MKLFDLGLVDFKKAWDFQKEVFQKVKNGNFSKALILCQHNPVITLGRLAKRDNILINEAQLSSREIQVYQIERGGDVTYHGPGQLIAYPVFNLSYIKKDIHFYLRYLEEKIIDLLSDFGINGVRIPGSTGVWINKKKIASIGVAIKNWISFHGLSINIKRGDLPNFNLIRPCGMDIEMVSLEDLLGRNIEVRDIKKRLINKFTKPWEEKDDKNCST